MTRTGQNVRNRAPGRRAAQRRLVLPALALAAALGLTACGGGGDPAGTSSGGHGSGHSSDGTGTSQANDADLAFLTGMVPHHEQAVEMSDIVLAADPPAEVAAIARKVKDAQAPEIERMHAVLEDLGEDPAAEHGAGHDGTVHGGTMSEADMAALEAATGTDAAKRYLEGMVEHHRGAIAASDAELADGEHEPARQLAQEIRTAQQAEIAEMQVLLARL